MKLLIQKKKKKKIFSSFCETARGKPYGNYLGLMDHVTTQSFFVCPLCHSPICSRSIARLTY